MDSGRFFQSMEDPKSSTLYSKSNDGIVRIEDVRSSMFLLQFDMSKIDGEDDDKKREIFERILQKVDKDDSSTYKLCNGLTLLHVFIVYGYDSLVGQFLKKVNF